MVERITCKNHYASVEASIVYTMKDMDLREIKKVSKTFRRPLQIVIQNEGFHYKSSFYI
uniref:Uncharacterized protein n=1 Tax=Lepeophtheirus salmonis TaxID=72036 RepID=A0A0K2UAP9_LEPSM